MGWVTGELHGNEGSPARQCSNHAHMGAGPRVNDAAIPAVVATSTTSAAAPTLDDPATPATAPTPITAPAIRANACPGPRARQNMAPPG